MNTPMNLPDTLTCLVGPPRSGTTLITNTFASHSKVVGILEPYQRGRSKQYQESNLLKFLNDHQLFDFSTTPHLAVKETFSRLVNIELIFDLMSSASDLGVAAKLILILRDPFAAYLSQLDASRTLWGQRTSGEDNEHALFVWAVAQITGLELLTKHAPNYQFCVVSYEQFCAKPKSETLRLMSLISLTSEEEQFLFRPPENLIGAADPKVKEKSGRIDVTDYAGRAEQVVERHGEKKEIIFMRALQQIVQDRIGQVSDLAILQDLIKMRENRNK